MITREALPALNGRQGDSDTEDPGSNPAKRRDVLGSAKCSTCYTCSFSGIFCKMTSGNSRVCMSLRREESPRVSEALKAAKKIGLNSGR